MEKESRFLIQKKIWWGKSKKGASDQTQTMLALRANKGIQYDFLMSAEFIQERFTRKINKLSSLYKGHMV